MPKRRKEASAPKPEESQRPPGDPADVASKEQCRVHKMFQLEQSQGKIYLSRSCFPSYVEDDIWAILQGCGFDYQTGGYRHDEMGISKIMNVDDIRELLLEKGIPADLDDDPDDEDDPDKVKRWIAFSHVPLKESDQEMLEETPLPSDYEALLVLCKLGFRVDGDTKQIYRGLYEQYDSIREIRAFLRSVDNVKLLTITDGDVFSPRKRARRATRKQDMPITDEELLTLRLWAATSPTPMRVFGQEYDVANVEDEAAPLVEIVEPEEEMEEEEEEPEEMDVEKEEEDEEEQSAPKGKSEVNEAATSPDRKSVV